MTQRKPKTAREVLLKLKGRGSWRTLVKTIERASGVRLNPGYLSAIVSGQRHASNTVLRAIGLPLKAVPVKPCERCGELHDFKKTCPKRLHAAPRLKPWRHLYELSDPQIAFLFSTRKEYSPMTDEGNQVNDAP